MAAHNLHVVMTNLRKEDPQTKCSGFEEQFKVSISAFLDIVCVYNVNACVINL